MAVDQVRLAEAREEAGRQMAFVLRPDAVARSLAGTLRTNHGDEAETMCLGIVRALLDEYEAGTKVPDYTLIGFTMALQELRRD